MSLRFHYLHPKEEDVAYARSGEDRMLRLVDPAPVGDEWAPATVELRGKDRPLDYLANTLDVRLCSQRLRDVVNATKGPGDAIEWLPVEVVDPGGTPYPYWAYHPLSYPDVLDRDRTLIGPTGDPMRPIIDLRRVTTERVFSVRGSIWLFVEESVKKAITKAKCTGVHFDKAGMTGA